MSQDSSERSGFNCSRALLESLKLHVLEAKDDGGSIERGSSTRSPPPGSSGRISSPLPTHSYQLKSSSVYSSYPVKNIQEKAALLVSRHQYVMERGEQYTHRLHLLHSQRAVIEPRVQEHRTLYRSRLDLWQSSCKRIDELAQEIERVSYILGAIEKKKEEYQLIKSVRQRLLIECLNGVDCQRAKWGSHRILSKKSCHFPEFIIRTESADDEVCSTKSLPSSTGNSFCVVNKWRRLMCSRLCFSTQTQSIPSSLHYACAYSSANEIHNIQSILLHSSPFLSRGVDQWGNNALHIACMAKAPKPEVVQQLLEAGLPCCHFNSFGLTPFHIAVLNTRGDNDHQIKDLLLHYGSSVNERTEAGLTAIQLVCAEDAYEDVIRFLVDRGAALFSTALYGADKRLSLLDRSRIHSAVTAPLCIKEGMKQCV